MAHELKKERPSWSEYFLSFAKLASTRSSCKRRHVGAVAVKNKRILATGYNGAVSGQPHCEEVGCLREKMDVPSGQRHEICLHGETKVKLLDGTYPTIKELSEREEETIWVYACSTRSGEICPALAHSPRKTGTRSDLVKIHLDNGSHLTCTKDHMILKRDGNYCEAGKLEPADSLMPMYYNFATNEGYESISNTIKTRKEGKSTTWKKVYKGRTKNTCTHKLVLERMYGPIKDGYIVHHLNENINDNRPENLFYTLKNKHSKHHNLLNGTHVPREKALLGSKISSEKIKNDPVVREKFVERGRKLMTANWQNKDFRDKMISQAKEKGKRTAQKTNSDPAAIKARMQAKILSGISMLEFVSNTKLNRDNYEETRKEYPVRKKKKEKGSAAPTIKTIKKWFGSFDEALQEARNNNHKVTSVEHIEGEHDVYDMTVPYFENFAVDLGDNSCVFVHNCRGVHAEQNLIIQAAKHGINLEKSVVYCTHMPCYICAKMLINCGIKEVYFADGYPDDLTKQLFFESNIRSTMIKHTG